MFHVRRRRAAFTLRGLLASALAAMAVIGVTAAGTGASGDDNHYTVTCQRDIRVPVTLASGRPAGAAVTGELCSSWAERLPGQTVQLLVPGASYTHDYWDFGTVDGTSYSYARAVAAEGIATFAIDPLGSGDSSHPASRQITAQADAYVDHQVVQALREGVIAGIRFRKVIAVGHSLNSLIVWDEAIAYHDVDGVIVTGVAHSLAAAFASSGGFYPAAKDPKFAGRGLDPGYLTTVPGVRGKLFYHLASADPVVIALDEARKDVFSGTELTTALPVVSDTATRAIDVPVLDVLGSDDFTTCGPSTTGRAFDCSSGAAVAAQEAPFYSPQAHLRACVIPGSGHDISLAPDNIRQVEDTVAWSETFVAHRWPGRAPGQGGHSLPSNCG